MLKNYIKIALRSLKRRKIYTFINILGLATGLACAVFIYNWVREEFSYDQHFPKKDRIFRVVAEAGVGNDRWNQSVTNLPLGVTMDSTFAEVQDYVRLDKNNAIVEQGDTRFVEDYIVFTDPSFFEIFDYHLLRGNERTALKNPYQVVLTESMAKKYFGEKDPIGRSLKMYLYDPEGRGAEYEVTGVIADPPETSHFTFNILGSLVTMDRAYPGELQNWGNNSYHTYVLLSENASPKALEQKLPAMVEAHVGDELRKYDLYYRYYLQPITDIHLHSHLIYEFNANGDITYIWIFSAIGIFILILAIINYINLSTSFALERAKETGLRKMMGAFRGELILQHLTETLVLTFFSMLVAGLLVEVSKPLFLQFTGKSHLMFSRAELVIQLLAMSIPLGLVAGYFPARKLATIQMVRSLKGTTGKDSTGKLRMVLVTFQFVVTLVILVGLVVVSQQLSFVRSKDLGYNKENLMVLRVNGNEDIKAGFEPFKTALKSNTAILEVARSGSMITNGLGNANGRVEYENGESRYQKLYRLTVDYDYLKVYGITLLAGRNFSPEAATDSTASFIINETAAAGYGWTPQEAVDQPLTYSGREGRIIGVVKDFHFNSLRHKIEPLCMYLQDNFARITVKGSNTAQMYQVVQQEWQKHFPAAIFDYTFQDQALFNSYTDDQRFSKIIDIFSGVSMLIAFLGLFGLVGYTVSRKTREIGIRKVLGATIPEIIALISGSFIRILAIAAVIAFPIAWWAMELWLKDFSYHIDIQWWFFAAAAAVILLFSLTIIFLQTVKTANTNPVNVLKEE